MVAWVTLGSQSVFQSLSQLFRRYTCYHTSDFFFFPVNLSFNTGWSQQEPKKKKENYFSSPTTAFRFAFYASFVQRIENLDGAYF